MQIRRFKRALLGEYDWAEPVKRARLKDENYVREAHLRSRSLPDRKRIALWSLHHFSPVEYGLAMALRLRGHDISGVLCDGLLPLCEFSLGQNFRPPCEACIANLSRYEEAFGFRYDRLSDQLSGGDRARAEQLVAEIPEQALLTLVVNDVPVGRLAHREIQRYYRGYIFDAPRDPAYRKWLVTAVLLTWLAERWLDKVSPDLVGLCSGRTLPTACMYEVARKRGVRTVTWDGAATRADTLMFSHDRPATEIPLDDAWTTASAEPLSPRQVEALDRFLADWSRSLTTPFPYNPKPVEDEAAIRAELGLRPGSSLVVAFTNTSWDIAVIDRDEGFESMFDWLFSLVDYAVRHPAVDLVVRAHPAEKNVPRELQSRTPVGAEIRRRFRPLPSNVRIVEGDNPISSYTLAGMAQVCMVYASRVGLEIALRGQRPWIAGAVTYRGKGFTLDLTSREHMFAMLDEGNFENRLSAEQVARAQRFAYLWFFRYEVRLPLLRPADKRFTLGSFRSLGPGGDPALDRVCEAFAAGKPFLDLNAASA